MGLWMNDTFFFTLFCIFHNRNITLIIRLFFKKSDLKCFLGPILWLKIKQTLCLPSIERQFPAWVADGVSASRAQRKKSDGSREHTPASSHTNKLSSECIWLCRRTKHYLKKYGRFSPVTKSYWKVLAKMVNRRPGARQTW